MHSLPEKNKKYFVTGIGTGIGKTVISAVLTEALEADYWKPVQCGELENTDSKKVKALISNPVSVIHEEAYCFKAAMSPHAAARLEKKQVDISGMHLPVTSNHVIVEGAGGIMVPLNDEQLVIDLIGQLNIPVIIVARIYLGSINHTLLTVEVLQKRNIPIAGIIFNDSENKESESFIARYTQINILGRISFEPQWTKETIKKYARLFKEKLLDQ